MSVSIKANRNKGAAALIKLLYRKVTQFSRRGSSFFIWEGASVYGTGKFAACLYNESAIRSDIPGTDDRGMQSKS